MPGRKQVRVAEKGGSKLAVYIDKPLQFDSQI